MKKLTVVLRGDDSESIAKVLEQIARELKTASQEDINLFGNISTEFDGVEVTKEFVDEEEVRKSFEEDAGYKLSDNQLQFCIDAEEQGFSIDFTYSGRSMYGKTCPSVIVEKFAEDLKTKATTSSDSMGQDTVIYARF